MTDARAEFVAGERPDDVVLFLSDRVVDDPETLLEYGEEVPGGVLLVMDGETGRSVFQSATEMDAMGFAGRAMRTDELDREVAEIKLAAEGVELDSISDAQAEYMGSWDHGT